MKKIISTYIITMLAFVALLAVSAHVPKEVIRKNMAMSAEVLCSRPVFYTMLEGVEVSRIDRYADSILLNIAWCFDGTMTQTMKRSYYSNEMQNENENLKDAIEQDFAPNQQYLRYWHGSAAIARLAHGTIILLNDHIFFVGICVV